MRKRLNKTEGRLSRSLVRLRRTEGFVKPALAPDSFCYAKARLASSVLQALARAQPKAEQEATRAQLR